MRKILLSLLFIGFGLLLAQSTQLLHCGKLLDVNNGQMLQEMTIVVEGGKIAAVEQGYRKAKSGESVIDLKEQTVMPGFIDLHVHLEGEYDKASYLQRFTLNEADIAFRSIGNARKTLLAGFTTVRDLGGTGVNVSLKNAINQGFVEGPRVFTAAKSIATTGGHADPTNGAKKGLYPEPGPAEGVANGPDECRQAVRQQIKNGADVIKITATGGVLSVARDSKSPQFTEEEARAIVETAKDYGLSVAAHAHGDEGMQRAIRAGVRSIEHGTFMSDETMELMKEKGTWYVPTLTAGRAVADSAKIPGFYPSLVTPKALHIGPKIADTFAKAYKKGVKIAFGTDAGVFPHGYNAIEFELMVEGGMPAIEAIRCATVHAAVVLDQQEKIGSIEAGKFADIVAVKGDPLKDIKLLQDISFVMKEGKVAKFKQ